LRNVLGEAGTSVGTPLAEALAAILEVDCRLNDQDNGLARLLALPRDELVELALDLDWALEHKAEFDLPLGGKVKGCYPGSIEIDGLCLVLDAGCPGLFPMEAMSRDAYGPNLEFLRYEIERLTRKLACRRIGLPTAVHLVDTDSRRLLQFPPFDEGAGVVLQRSAADTGAARFCSASPQQIRDFAKDIVLDMRALWTNRLAVAARVTEVRRAAEQAAAEAPAEAGVHSIDIEMRHQRDQTSFLLYVEYQAIDEAMRPGIVLQCVPSHHDVSEGLRRAPFGVRGRWKDLVELRGYGADGWIDEMAFCALKAAPEGASAVLAKLATSYETTVTIPAGNKPLFATFYWRGGCIRAELAVPGELEYTLNDLDLLGASMPETTLAHLPGQSVSSVIELPFDCTCEIEVVTRLHTGGIRMEINSRRQLVNLGSGQIWPEPEPKLQF